MEVDLKQRLNPEMNGVVQNGVHKAEPQPQQHTSLKFEDVTATAEHLLQKTKHRPRIGVVCGSGLGGLVNVLDDTDAFHYKDIPGFPVSTVPGHAGRLVFGKLRNTTVVCMQGRMHGYEGYPMWKITFPIRVMKELGVDTLMVTNAAGGLNRNYKVGDLMIIKDHLNLPGMAGINPLIGLTDPRFGPRFPPLSKAYDRSLRQLAREVADELKFDFVREGVYAFQCGPAFETIAECRMLMTMGADCTGMSTVPEVMVAIHCGMRTFGMSLVTNECVVDYDVEQMANHEEVLETGRMRAQDMQKFFAKLLERMETEA